MATTIADYVASLRLKPDLKSLNTADRFFKLLDSKVARYSKKINKSGNLLGVGNTVKGVQEVERAEAKRSKSNIANTAREADAHIKAYERRIKAENQLERLRMANERLKLSQAAGSRAAERHAYWRSNVNRPIAAQSAGSYRNLTTLGGAGIAGFGLSSLNKVTQRLEMLPISMEAVAGSAEEAAKQLQFLEELGKRVGATRLELVPEYTKFYASARGTKLEGEAQTIFSSLTSYGKVMGLDQEEMKGSFRALTQMISKQQIYAEELKGQLAERMPAAVRIMAEAVAGGDTKKLFKMMEAGQLDPNEALPKFAMELEARSAGGWNKYRQTSRYKQNISAVALEDQFMLMNKSGGNSAWFKIWSTFADTLPRMAPLFKAAGQAADFFAGKFQGLGDIIGGLSAIVGQVQGITYATEDMSNRLAQLAPFLAAFWKRAFAPLYGAYLIIQDIAGYSMGMKSVTGMAFDFMQGKGAHASALAPQNIRQSNPYEGKPFAGLAFNAMKQEQASGDIMSTVKHGFWRSASFLYNPYVDLGKMLFTPNVDNNMVRLTPESQMNAAINNVAYGGKGAQGLGMPNFNITINAETNDPQELANIVTKTISSQTIPFLLRNNGE